MKQSCSRHSINFSTLDRSSLLTGALAKPLCRKKVAHATCMRLCRAMMQNRHLAPAQAAGQLLSSEQKPHHNSLLIQEALEMMQAHLSGWWSVIQAISAASGDPLFLERAFAQAAGQVKASLSSGGVNLRTGLKMGFTSCGHAR